MSETNKHDVNVAWVNTIKWIAPFLILALIFAGPLRDFVKRVSANASEFEGFGIKVSLQEKFSTDHDKRYQKAINQLSSDEIELLLRFQKPSPNSLGHGFSFISENKLYVLKEFYSDEISNLMSLNLLKATRQPQELETLVASLEISKVRTDEVYFVYDVSGLDKMDTQELEAYIELTTFGDSLTEAIYDTVKQYWR